MPTLVDIRLPYGHEERVARALASAKPEARIGVITHAADVLPLLSANGHSST